MTGPQLSTGLPALDSVLGGLISGDNLVWQVHSIEDYLPFADAYCRAALAAEKTLVYFRFGKHAPLVPKDVEAEIHVLHPESGFEQFITEIHRTIDGARADAFYIFDCLSDLAVDWCSDRMLGNFFMLTCPYVYDVGAIAYFPVLRNYHSFQATTPISQTTQILLDVYRHEGKLYVYPIKVQQRYSPTMYMLHAWEGDAFVPVTESSTTSEILTSIPWAGMEAARSRLGVWNRAFLEAEEVRDPVHRGRCPLPEAEDVRFRLLRMAVTRDERVLRLAEKFFNLGDVLDIWKRMIGTGLIGGKSVGMLLARAILKKTDERWCDLLEAHDSFFIGSDVFYTFLVQNGCWWVRQKQKSPETFLEGAEDARRRILMGRFPDDVVKDISDMLDYFGQSPIIVRSSSLLEDNFGNSFAGKYESVFCANQGPHHKRLEDFLSAVRTIYASTMSEKALLYRAQRGMLDRDEQMALLVQRVSGSLYGNLYFPQIAGVGLSFNPYVWSEHIDPKVGMLRLVFGLGTRAVDRSDDDYTRVVALNAPDRRPEADFDQVRQYAQRNVDLLDLHSNRLVSRDFLDLTKERLAMPVEMFASRDRTFDGQMGNTQSQTAELWVLTFEKLLSETPFVEDMREMLRTLQEAYDYPVDTEFTANFFGNDSYKINLVQCRPLQVQVTGAAAVTSLPASIKEEDLVLEARGAVIGPSRLSTIDRLIYVVPSVYGRLPVNERYSIARLIGRLTRGNKGGPPKTVMLLGPGRWGTTTPSLGVPVSFAEINTISVLCEIVAMREDLIPDVSLGTHFFNELVEMDILYLALFPNREGNRLNETFFDRAPNRLSALAPEAAGRSDVIRVIDTADLGAGRILKLNANTLSQKVVCYLDPVGIQAEDYTTP